MDLDAINCFSHLLPSIDWSTFYETILMASRITVEMFDQQTSQSVSLPTDAIKIILSYDTIDFEQVNEFEELIYSRLIN
jgi:hypothetical protein